MDKVKERHIIIKSHTHTDTHTEQWQKINFKAIRRKSPHSEQKNKGKNDSRPLTTPGNKTAQEAMT